MVGLAWSCDVLLRFRDGEDAVLSLVVVFDLLGRCVYVTTSFFFSVVWVEGLFAFLCFFIRWDLKSYNELLCDGSKHFAFA